MQMPSYVATIINKLEKAGFEAYAVGGCVRDLLLKKEPKDWDVASNARPEQVLEVFPEAKYENMFGTVLISVRKLGIENEENIDVEITDTKKEVVEITTYRSEQGYSDRRHPDDVKFEDRLDKDLERRDFTINALALGDKIPKDAPVRDFKLGEKSMKLIDLFGGQKDIDKKIIRAVGEPSERFKEDALRMMRAIRFSSQLDFSIEPKTERAIVKLAGSIKFISNERIKDELIKILESDRPYEGFMALQRTRLLRFIMPELERGIDVQQDRHHVYPVFQHCMLSLKHCPSRDWRVRLAALLHDVGKPQTKKIINGIATFYNHEYAGARLAERIMKRLKFSNEDKEKVVTLVKYHMFYYNTDEVTASSVRRLIQKVGKENLEDLIDLRIADRLGSGTPKAKPYKLRHLEYMFKRVQNDPVSVKSLKINGDELMPLLEIQPGPKIGAILEVLLGEVIEDPELNNKDYLEKRSRELNVLELNDIRKKAKDKIEEKRERDDKKMKGEFFVQ